MVASKKNIVSKHQTDIVIPYEGFRDEKSLRYLQVAAEPGNQSTGPSFLRRPGGSDSVGDLLRSR